MRDALIGYGSTVTRVDDFASDPSPRSRHVLSCFLVCHIAARSRWAPIVPCFACSSHTRFGPAPYYPITAVTTALRPTGVGHFLGF